MFTDSGTSKFCKIDLIKIFKTMVCIGLLESKIATEAWLNANGIDYVDTIYELRSFVMYATAFVQGEIEIGDHNLIVSTKPRTLSIGDIKSY